MKQEILNILESRRGEYISGEELAENFMVSRAAIWKVIASLRKDGHVIKSRTNKGYMLENFSDVLTEQGIISHLKHDTLIKQVICFNEIDSTNNYAKRLAMSNQALHGTLIAANYQTSGRGRLGHSFESPAGTGLYMSIVLKSENIESAKFQFITIVDAVSVCLAIESLCPELRDETKIKWVNDILIHGKKITGILTEAITSFESGEIDSVVTGIGINVTTKKFAGDYNAGSIFPDGSAKFSRNELCARVADYIMDFAKNLTQPFIIQEYRKRSVLINQDITYMKDNEIFTGHVTGISDDGGLEIINQSGIKETLRSGEVNTIRRQ